MFVPTTASRVARVPLVLCPALCWRAPNVTGDASYLFKLLQILRHNVHVLRAGVLAEGLSPLSPFGGSPQTLPSSSFHNPYLLRPRNAIQIAMAFQRRLDAARNEALVRWLANDDPLSEAGLADFDLFQEADGFMRAGPVCSPPVKLGPDDVQPKSPWAWIKESPRESSFFKTLGIDFRSYMHMCEACRPSLAKYDRSVPRPGPFTNLNHEDVVAVVLRRYQKNSERELEDLVREFGGSLSTMSRILDDTDGILLPVLRPYLRGGLRRPDRALGDEMQRAFIMQHGRPPFTFEQWKALNLLYAIDGTKSPAESSPDETIRRQFYVDKVCCVKHILCVDIFGYIRWYELCVPGSVHDARASAPIMESLLSKEDNPHRFGGAGDSAWVGSATTWPRIEREEVVAIVVPATTGFYISSDMPVVKKASACYSCFRVGIENVNNGVEHGFPRWNKPVTMQDFFSGRSARDFETMVGLWNFRCANCGYSTVQTTYMRHTRPSFERAVTKQRQLPGEAGFAAYMAEMRAMVDFEGRLESLGFRDPPPPPAAAGDGAAAAGDGVPPFP